MPITFPKYKNLFCQTWKNEGYCITRDMYTYHPLCKHHLDPGASNIPQKKHQSLHGCAPQEGSLTWSKGLQKMHTSREKVKTTKFYNLVTTETVSITKIIVSVDLQIL